jgi:hypothetical protein
MIELLKQGGLLFTLPLTAIALAVLGAATGAALVWLTGQGEARRWRRAVFHLGLFALVFGLLSHAVSLYQMMHAIEGAGGVSPAMVMGGLRVSLIAPVYGLGIFAAALLLWAALDFFTRSPHP